MGKGSSYTSVALSYLGSITAPISRAHSGLWVCASTLSRSMAIPISAWEGLRVCKLVFCFSASKSYK